MLYVKQLQVFQYLKQSRTVVVAAAAAPASEGMSVRAQRVVVAKCINLNQVWRIQAQIHLARVWTLVSIYVYM